MTDKATGAGNVIPFPGGRRVLSLRADAEQDAVGLAAVGVRVAPVYMHRLKVEFAATGFGEHWYHEAAVDEGRKPRLKQ